jgi:hypothetical protein
MSRWFHYLCSSCYTAFPLPLPSCTSQRQCLLCSYHSNSILKLRTLLSPSFVFRFFFYFSLSVYTPFNLKPYRRISHFSTCHSLRRRAMSTSFLLPPRIVFPVTKRPHAPLAILVSRLYLSLRHSSHQVRRVNFLYSLNIINKVKASCTPSIKCRTTFLLTAFLLATAQQQFVNKKLVSLECVYTGHKFVAQYHNGRGWSRCYTGSCSLQ